MPHPAPSLRESFHSVALCAFAYLYVFPYFPAINNPNENVRLYMTAAIAEEGHYEINAIRKRWGWVNDAAKYKGRLYSVKAPGTSLLGVPAYAVYYALANHALPGGFDRAAALWLCRVSASILPMLAFLWLFHRFLATAGAAPWLRESVFFSVALGSLLYGYSILFVSHATSAAAAFCALVLLWPGPDGDAPNGVRAAAAGLCTGAVTLLEYPCLPVSVTLAVFGATRMRRRYRDLAWFALGGLVPTLAMMHFQWRAFDNPLTPGHLFVESAAFRERHHEGFYGAVGVSGAALYGLLLAPGRGLFPLTPILLFAVPGFRQLIGDRKTRAAGITALTACVATLLVIASMNNWSGGWTIGPRYLAVTVPFMGWAALRGLKSAHERAPSAAAIAAVACTVVGLALSGVPSAYYPHYPPEVLRPLSQVIGPLMASGRVPDNVGQRIGLTGNPSMLPLAVCAGLVVLRCAGGWRGARGRDLTIGLTAGIIITALLAAPIGLDRREQKRAHGAARFIEKHWSS